MGSPSTASTTQGFGDAPPKTAAQQGGGRGGRGGRGGGGSTMQYLPPQVFRRMTISSTGFSEQTNINFRSLVETHGGVFTTHFNVHVTALIASAVDTEKYRGAVKFGTPVVTRAWVDASIAHGKAVDFASYLLPPLCELKVTSTGFMPDEKRVLREAVERLGGVYTTDLEMDVTSFLIARRAEGDKYQAARKWNIRVVSRDWLQACERRKVCDSGEGFPVLPTTHSPPPLHKGGGREGRGKGGLARSHSMGLPIAQELPPLSHLVRPEALPHMAGGHRYEGGKEGGKEGKWEDDVEAAFPSLPSSMGLDGCVVFVAGKDRIGTRLKKVITLLVRKGGAALAPRVDSAVTHVLVADVMFLTASNVQQLVKHPTSPLVVTREWLLASVQAQRPLCPTEEGSEGGKEGGKVFGVLRKEGSGGGGGGEGGGGRREGRAALLFPPPSMSSLRRSHTFSAGSVGAGGGGGEEWKEEGREGGHSGTCWRGVLERGSREGKKRKKGKYSMESDQDEEMGEGGEEARREGEEERKEGQVEGGTDNDGIAQHYSAAGLPSLPPSLPPTSDTGASSIFPKPLPSTRGPWKSLVSSSISSASTPSSSSSSSSSSTTGSLLRKRPLSVGGSINPPLLPPSFPPTTSTTTPTTLHPSHQHLLGPRRRSLFDCALRQKEDSQPQNGEGSVLPDESQVIGYGNG